jgi:glycosyltransferase involved in cell wall biosynthesis
VTAEQRNEVVSQQAAPTSTGDQPSGGSNSKVLGPDKTERGMFSAGREEPVSVLLLRDVPEHGSRSMERFADEMNAGLQGRPDVRVSETTIHASRLYAHRLWRRLDRYSSLFIRYPLHVRRQAARVYHIIDHSYGHLLGCIPAERAVITCHDLILLHAEREDIGFRGSRLLLRRFRWETSFLRRAAIVACVSEATASDAIELLHLDPARIRVIPMGISPSFVPISDESRAQVRRALDPTGRRALVLQVSSGAAYKNIPGTLRVIRELRSRGLDPVLARVGKPLNAEQVAHAKEMGVLSSVREFGRASDQELAGLYAAADVLLFPSRWEGFGWPPLEALACGTPSVVASECRSVVDLLGNAALAEPADDVRALASAVEMVVKTPALRATLVERGRARVHALTWPRTVEAYLMAYEEIAAGLRSSPRRIRR